MFLTHVLVLLVTVVTGYKQLLVVTDLEFTIKLVLNFLLPFNRSDKLLLNLLLNLIVIDYI